MESKRITKHIDRLLLDPNNYRFIDKSDYNRVSDEQIADDRIQQRTYNFIAGKKNENISDLITSFKTNGFLDIDQIQVKAVDDKYLVLEGNRRTATLKYLYDEFKKGNDIGKLTENDFKSINIVEIKDENPAQHLITMGLHHISGKKRWSAVNESQLVSDLQNIYNLSKDEICDSLGITKQKLNRNLRTLSLIKQYKDSDFGDQFKTEMYTIFETVVSNAAIKSWIGWNDSNYIASNEINIERFFSWISQTEEIEINEDSNEDHTVTKDPIITQYRQIKELAAFINDEKAVERMEKSRSIAEGYTFSDEVGEIKLKNALSNIKTEVQAVFNFSEYMTEEDYSDVSRLKDKFDKLTPTNFAIIKTNEKNAIKYFQSINEHFKNINIARYRKLYQINIKHLSRINIFAGGNNLGKTSILESFYLLSQLNDVNALFELERYRGKFYNEFQSKWFDKSISDSIEISGVFNETSLDISIQKEDTIDNIDKTNYLSTVKVEAKVNGTDLESNVHLYSNREPDLRYTRIQTLCQSSFTSPYRYNIDLLSRAYSHAVEGKYYDEIVDFIRDNMDSSIMKITLVDNRFIVDSNKLDTTIDITKYGEGMQRVFEIALLMGYNRDGILCIDEIDCAIHHSLLVTFSIFLQKLAKQFNVQVFLSTHSKECIDAFIEAKYNENKDITAYSLTEENGKVVCKYVSGERLESLIQSINFDIR